MDDGVRNDVTCDAARASACASTPIMQSALSVCVSVCLCARGAKPFSERANYRTQRTHRSRAGNCVQTDAIACTTTRIQYVAILCAHLRFFAIAQHSGGTQSLSRIRFCAASEPARDHKHSSLRCCNDRPAAHRALSAPPLLHIGAHRERDQRKRKRDARTDERTRRFVRESVTHAQTHGRANERIQTHEHEHA